MKNDLSCKCRTNSKVKGNVIIGTKRKFHWNKSQQNVNVFFNLYHVSRVYRT